MAKFIFMHFEKFIKIPYIFQFAPFYYIVFFRINIIYLGTSLLTKVHHALRRITIGKEVIDKDNNICATLALVMLVNVAGISGSIHTEDGIYADFCGYFPIEKPKYTVFVSYKRSGTPAPRGNMAGRTFRKITELLQKNNK